MSINQFLNLIISGRKTILKIVLAFLIITLILSFAQVLKYEANSRVLVVQSYSQGTDPYIMSKANDYLSGIFVQAIFSDSFFQEVLNSGFNIDKNYFPASSHDKIKKWQKTVSAVNLRDSGIIEISVYHPDSKQAEQIARAVNYILYTKNKLYHGGGDSVKIRVIDAPIVSNFPVKPNLLINLSLALIAGLACGFYYIYFLSLNNKTEPVVDSWWK